MQRPLRATLPVERARTFDRPLGEDELEGVQRGVLPGNSIASLGPVRSILLFSLKPMEAIETLATDTSSRTSVGMAEMESRAHAPASSITSMALSGRKRSLM